MKINIITGPFLPLPPASCGAVERLWFDLGHEFASRGHSVTFCARSVPGTPRIEKNGQVTVKRVSGYRRTNRIVSDLVKDLFYSIAVAFRLPPADITVTNVFWLPALLTLRSRRGSRVVVNVARFPKGQMRLYRRVDCLYAVSSAVKSGILQQAHYLEKQVEVIPNPINTSVFVPPREPRIYGPNRAILYTGRVTAEKGLHHLIPAFRILHGQIPGLSLQIMGPVRTEEGGGGEAYRRRLEELAQGSPVSFLPATADPTALAAALQSAHYYCYPSIAEKGESFGVAPLEAMGTGLAPVVSALECFRDFITDGENGVVFNHRAADPVQELVAALQRLIRDDAATIRMGRAAAAKAQEFSVARVATMYLESFEAILKGR